jgi:toxin HigB-1
VIRGFKDRRAQRLHDGQRVPELGAIERQVVKRLRLLDAAESLDALAGLPSNRLERLRGDRRGQHSIRINDQWRICFEWDEDGPFNVEIVDYH